MNETFIYVLSHIYVIGDPNGKYDFINTKSSAK